MESATGFWKKAEVDKCETGNKSLGDKMWCGVVQLIEAHSVFVLWLFIQAIISSTHFPWFLQHTQSLPLLQPKKKKERFPFTLFQQFCFHLFHAVSSATLAAIYSKHIYTRTWAEGRDRHYTAKSMWTQVKQLVRSGHGLTEQDISRWDLRYYDGNFSLLSDISLTQTMEKMISSWSLIDE